MTGGSHSSAWIHLRQFCRMKILKVVERPLWVFFQKFMQTKNAAVKCSLVPDLNPYCILLVLVLLKCAFLTESQMLVFYFFSYQGHFVLRKKKKDAHKDSVINKLKLAS